MLIEDLYRPWYLIYLSAYYGVVEVLTLLASGQVSTLLSPSAFRTGWFARFWAYFGPRSSENSAPQVGPMLATASGRVLDIGSGSGNWLKYYDPTKVSWLYAVEPNTGHHATLKDNARRAGLEGKLQVVTELSAAGIKSGSIDTVTTVMVLCSVGEQGPLVKECYGYLKSGGRWIVYEHVKRKENVFIVWYQGELLIFPCVDRLRVINSWLRIGF